jgi:hypothetical protein
MNAVQGKKVFVHRAANKRVTSFMALYGEARLGWSREKGNDFMRRIWQPDEAWASLIALVRQERERNS